MRVRIQREYQRVKSSAGLNPVLAEIAYILSPHLLPAHYVERTEDYDYS